MDEKQLALAESLAKTLEHPRDDRSFWTAVAEAQGQMTALIAEVRRLRSALDSVDAMLTAERDGTRTSDEQILRMSQSEGIFVATVAKTVLTVRQALRGGDGDPNTRAYEACAVAVREVLASMAKDGEIDALTAGQAEVAIIERFGKALRGEDGGEQG